ncbi:hypothetical protein VP01_457g17 [Puccinia sorghi]|uniref:Uncharacterized protein n=1 Tax=Puccinia sorghi TaxID=27349 RepID=A0A0L6UNM3_9BASI|nr:hypothetical protein VP01_457g17 [Puccinia sorghi]
MNQRLRGINLGRTVHRRSSRTGAGDPADDLLLSHARGGRERVSGGDCCEPQDQGKATRVFGEGYWASKPLIAADSLRWLDGAAIAVRWADLCERTGQRPAGSTTHRLALHLTTAGPQRLEGARLALHHDLPDSWHPSELSLQFASCFEPNMPNNFRLNGQQAPLSTTHWPVGSLSCLIGEEASLLSTDPVSILFFHSQGVRTSDYYLEEDNKVPISWETRSLFQINVVKAISQAFNTVKSFHTQFLKSVLDQDTKFYSGIEELSKSHPFDGTRKAKIMSTSLISNHLPATKDAEPRSLAGSVFEETLYPLRPRPGVPQQKRGKLLQVTLIQRPGGVYTNDRFMQVLFRAEVPIIEIIGSGNLLMTIYNGKSFIYRISIRNAGQVELKDFQSVISHPGSSQIHSSQSATIIIQTPNHMLPELPTLLAPDLKADGAVEGPIVCRGEGVGQHATCWLFVFWHAASGEVLSFQYVQYLTVLPSLLIKLLIPPSFTPDAFYLLTLELNCLDLPEDIEVYQVSTIRTHFASKWIDCHPGSAPPLHLPKGSSSVNLAFESRPSPDSQDDLTTITMLEQLKKEKLGLEEISKSPIAQPFVRRDAPTLLNTVLTSHRATRRKALEGYFTSLASVQIGFLFPRTTSQSMVMILFWRTKESGKLGHHALSGLSFGASVNQLRSTLEIPFVEWDFEKKGDICRPLTPLLTFTIKNLSMTHAAGYELVLVQEDPGPLILRACTTASSSALASSRISSSSPPGLPTCATRPSTSLPISPPTRPPRPSSTPSHTHTLSPRLPPS